MHWISCLPCVVLLAAGLAGCLGPEAAEAGALASLDVYRFDLAGPETFVPGHGHGWALRVANPTSDDVAFRVWPYGTPGVAWGPVAPDGWSPLHRDAHCGPGLDRGDQATLLLEGGHGPVHGLPPGGAVLFLVEATAYGADCPGGPSHGAGFVVQVGEEATAEGVPVFRPSEHGVFPMDVVGGGGRGVEAGMHVQTVTVGLWINGTSFYTNSPGLLRDPDFPAGGHIDREEALEAAEPLQVYVYDESTAEQPAGSRDACYFVTVAGYNELLKTQAEGSTGVRFLAPEEAYTRPGAEGHFLYGDPLVFLNHVVAIDGKTGLADHLPDPRGECSVAATLPATGTAPAPG